MGKNEFFRSKFSLKTPNLFQVDPRTGKPSPLPGAQREINQNGPLPVIEIVRMNSISIFCFSLSHIGKFEHWKTVVSITLITVNRSCFRFFEFIFSSLVNKTTNWTDPRIAGPVNFLSFFSTKLECEFCQGCTLFT